ncbi:MAG: TfoX/Sxy family protein [Rhizobiales bacterium]|nr:TfoX/Sxy family protein [Hyphomicrobiales bacterium]
MPGSLLDPDFLKDLFQPFATISVRAMFGGQGIMREGLMFALVDDGVIYLKSDAETDGHFAAEGLELFVYETKAGKQMPMNYRRMPEACFDDEDSVRRWAGYAWSAALRAAARKPAAKKKRAKSE